MPIIPSHGSLETRLTAIERRLRDLEKSSRLGNSSITAGALIVRDANGTEQARIGLLPDGSYGITGRLVGSSATGGAVPGPVFLSGQDSTSVHTPICQFTSNFGNIGFFVEIGLGLTSTTAGQTLSAIGYIKHLASGQEFTTAGGVNATTAIPTPPSTFVGGYVAGGPMGLYECGVIDGFAGPGTIAGYLSSVTTAIVIPQ